MSLYMSLYTYNILVSWWNRDTRCFEHKLKNRHVKQCSLETRIIWFVNIPKILTKSYMMQPIVTESYCSAISFHLLQLFLFLLFHFPVKTIQFFFFCFPLFNFFFVFFLFFCFFVFFFFHINLSSGSLPNATLLYYYLYCFLVGDVRLPFLFVSSFEHYYFQDRKSVV